MTIQLFIIISAPRYLILMMDISQAPLPIVDLSAFKSPDASVRAAEATKMRDACVKCGFFYIKNHDFDPEVITAVRKQSKEFFDLPLKDKDEIDIRYSNCYRGYEPLRGQRLEAGAPPDVKEGFYMGRHKELDDPEIKGRFNQGPNQWPSKLPNFKPTLETYYKHCTAIMETLMNGLALSLGLSEQYFVENGFLKDPIGTLRLLHYPPHPVDAQPDEKGCGAHTDFGAVTILFQDDSGGLQVLSADGKQWIDAPPIEGTFVVNMGDLISRWTNEKYHSNVHRVINKSGRDRYSIPFFFEGGLDCLVECLPTCLDEGETPKYPPITVEDNLRNCFNRTYGGVREEVAV